MKRPAFCFASMCALFVPQYSCHKPTPQERYAHARHCYVVLNASLTIVTPGRLRQAGYDRGAVEVASDDDMGEAYDSGKQMGMNPTAIFKDLQRAKTAYRKSEAERSGADLNRKRSSLRDDVTNCLADYYGRPND